MTLKRLFFEPKSYCFDFVLESDTQGTVPAVKSRAHDTAMYLFEGGLDKPFASEFLTFPFRTSLASSLASPSTLSPAPPVA